MSKAAKKKSQPQSVSESDKALAKAADNLNQAMLEVIGLMKLVCSVIDKGTDGRLDDIILTTDECVSLHYLATHILRRLEQADDWTSTLHAKFWLASDSGKEAA